MWRPVLSRGKNLRDQALKAWIAAQGIEQRLDLEIDDVGVGWFATGPLNVFKRPLIFT